MYVLIQLHSAKRQCARKLEQKIITAFTFTVELTGRTRKSKIIQPSLLQSCIFPHTTLIELHRTGRI